MDHLGSRSTGNYDGRRLLSCSDGFFGSKAVFILLGIISILVFCLLSVSIEENDLVGGDEGYYATMARNILAGGSAINLSLSPMGPPGDKPFLFPAILAAGIRIGGVREASVRIPTLAFAILCALLLFALGHQLGHPEAGAWAALLWITSPLVAYAGRVVQAETPLTALSLAGASLLIAAAGRRSWWLAALAGLLFGLGFLTKLWLVLPTYTAAVAGALLLPRAEVPRARVDSPAQRGDNHSPLGFPSVGAGRIGVIAVASCAFIVTGSIQLILCALLTPDTLSHWFQVYFGFSLVGRMDESGFAEFWIRPWSYYIELIARTVALWIPLIVSGFVALLVKSGVPSGRLAWRAVILIWLLPLVPLSMAPVKSGVYMVPFLPAFALLAGVGLGRLRSAVCETGSALSMRRQFALVAVLSFVTIGILHLGRSEDWTITSLVPVAIQIGWGAAFTVLAAWPSWRAGRTVSAGACLLLVIGAGLGRDVQLVRSRNHVTGYRAIAEILRPALDGVDPSRSCFFAPEWPSMSFYAFRSGRYWESPYVPADPDLVRAALLSDEPWFFVLTETRRYGGAPDSATTVSIQELGVPVLAKHGSKVYGNAALIRRLPQDP